MSGLSQILGDVLIQAKHPLNILYLCKGLEPNTALLPHQVLQRELAKHPSHAHAFGVLSGPSFAREVGEGLPCALTVASHQKEFCELVQQVFHHGNIRVYASDDLIDEIEADEDGVINLALAKRAKQIDFEIQVPFEKQDGVSLRSVINPSEKQS
jgi:glycerol-3-phosphate dehydrogenase